MFFGKPMSLQQWVNAKKDQKAILGDYLPTCSICQQEIAKSEEKIKSKDGSTQHLKCKNQINFDNL